MPQNLMTALQEGEEKLLVTSGYINRNKLWPDGPLGSCADFTLPTRLKGLYYNLPVLDVLVKSYLGQKG